MLDALKFVQGAVSRKDFVAELTHFRIRGGRITGYNGKISISSPIDLDIDCCPKASAFVKAIQSCEETAQLHLTASGKLAIRSGRFRTHVDTIAESFVGVDPEGVRVEIDGQLMPALSKLFDFTSEDASRPWASGILLSGNSAYATNNVILVEHWLGYFFPYRINLPRYALKEILRIGEEPIGLQLTSNNATFHYAGNRWLRTQLHSTEWPDINAMLELIPPTVSTVPAGLFEALQTISPFVDELSRVYFLDGKICTLPTEASEGTCVDVLGLGAGPIFNASMLSSLEGIATRIGFEEYPRPCPFYGEKVRGLIMGMKP